MNDDVQRWINEAVEQPSIVEAEGYAILPRSSAGRDGLRAIRISTLDEVMQLRMLRNECAPFMTHHRAEITEAQQLVWWQSVSGSADWKVWLVYRRDFPAAIGFLLLRRGAVLEDPDIARWYVTIGLAASERRKGYGQWLYRASRSLTGGEPVNALILRTNEASIKAAVRAGYEIAPQRLSSPTVIRMVGSPE
jgi:hypothetical protein